MGFGRKIKTILLDLFFPPRCASCQGVGFWLCPRCRAEIALIRPPLCLLCGRPIAEKVPGAALPPELCSSCRSAPLQIDGIRSAAYFEGPLREAIHRFKYRELSALALPLGEVLSEGWRVNRPPGEVIVPVPLHPKRLRERGYNQAALLAKELGKKIGLPVVGNLLVRVRETLPQTNLKGRERKENVRDAFRCHGHELKGKCVLLIDDVCTTGATLEACSLALRGSAVRSVWALSLARPRENIAF